ncbi:MAG: hypothetical protein RR614_00785 [Eubacterium sp.]
MGKTEKRMIDSILNVANLMSDKSYQYEDLDKIDAVDIKAFNFCTTAKDHEQGGYMSSGRVQSSSKFGITSEKFLDLWADFKKDER